MSTSKASIRYSEKREGISESGLAEALSAVLKALKPFTPDEARRVLRAAMVFYDPD